MMLTSSESVIWRVPAPSWARRKVKEWRDLGDDQAAAQRKATLLAELPQIVEYRLTFATVTMAEEIKRDELLTAVREKFEADYKINPGSYSLWFVDKFIREIEPDIAYEEGENLDKNLASIIFMKTRDMADWATFMSALHTLEERKTSMLNGSEVAWNVIPVPPGWLDFQAFLAQIPRKLLDSCIEICNDLNPGVWEVQMDEDSKNFGGVNVSN